MIEAKRFLRSVLETDLLQDLLLSAEEIKTAALEDGEANFSVSLKRKVAHTGLLYFDKDEESERELFTRVRFYRDGILRLMISLAPRRFNDESEMVQLDPTLEAQDAGLSDENGAWVASGSGGAFFSTGSGGFMPALSPDGRVTLQFQAHDQFEPTVLDSLPVFVLFRSGGGVTMGFSLQIPPGENYCGTGERFERLNLFGQQIDLINHDARG